MRVRVWSARYKKGFADTARRRSTKFCLAKKPQPVEAAPKAKPPKRAAAPRTPEQGKRKPTCPETYQNRARKYVLMLVIPDDVSSLDKLPVVCTPEAKPGRSRRREKTERKSAAFLEPAHDQPQYSHWEGRLALFEVVKEIAEHRPE